MKPTRRQRAQEVVPMMELPALIGHSIGEKRKKQTNKERKKQKERNTTETNLDLNQVCRGIGDCSEEESPTPLHS
jgi:hypothetical protein